MGVLDTDKRVFALAFARMADAVGNSFLIVILPAYVASIVGESGAAVAGVSLSTTLLVGVVLSVFGFVNSGLQPFTGRLSDQLGRRRVFILVGLVLLGAGSAGYPFVDSYGALVALRALQGAGGALIIPPTVALVNELGDSGTRGGNFGVFNTFRLIGFGFGPFVAGGVQQLYGFDAAFAVAVASAALGFLLVVLLVDDPEETGAAAGDDISIAVRGDDTLLDPVFSLGVATVVVAMGIALFATLEAPINDRLDQGAFLFGAQFGVAVLANVVLQIPIGQASDRYGRRPFVLAGLLLLIPSTLVQGFVTTSVAMIVARLVQGVAVALVFPISLALAGDLAGEGRSGSTLSILTTGFGLGTAIGPLVSGLLEGFGYVVPFAFVAGLGVFALVLVQTQVSEPEAGESDRPPGGEPTPGE